MDITTTRLDYNDIYHLATLTDKEILVELLVAIKKLGKKAQQWILGTIQGRRVFADLGKRTIELELCPKDWSISFKQDMAHYSVPDTSTSEHLISTGELLNLAVEQIMVGKSHFNRLSKAVETNLILASKGESGYCSTSIRTASALVKASTEDQNSPLQSNVMSILLKALRNEKNANVIAAVQMPIIHRLMMPTMKSSGIDFSSSDLGMKSMPDPKRSSNELKMLRFVEAASLARRGNQIGSKHGCVICIPRHIVCKNEMIRGKLPSFVGDKEASTNYDVVVGRGWNHNVLVNLDSKGGKKRMIHSEVHAVADTIRTFGEDLAFQHIFPHSEIIIVELHKDVSYDNAPPCPKCNTLLRAVGICKACHSTDRGVVEHMSLDRSKLEFLDRETVRIPLRTVCNELGIHCRRLSEAEERVMQRKS